MNIRVIIIPLFPCSRFRLPLFLKIFYTLPDLLYKACYFKRTTYVNLIEVLLITQEQTKRKISYSYKLISPR